MEKSIKLLLTIVFLLLTFSINAQNDCGVVCHNGRLLTGVNENAIEHLVAQGAIFITIDCDYEETGDECSTLGLPVFEFKNIIPIGLVYYISDISGKIYKIGLTDQTSLFNILPIDHLVFLKVEGYKTKRIIKTQ